MPIRVERACRQNHCADACQVSDGNGSLRRFRDNLNFFSLHGQLQVEELSCSFQLQSGHLCLQRGSPHSLIRDTTKSDGRAIAANAQHVTLRTTCIPKNAARQPHEGCLSPSALYYCCGPAPRSQRRMKSMAFGTLFWFTVPGQMVPAGKAFTTFLLRMATTSASSKSRRRPLKKMSPRRSASLLNKMGRAFLLLTATGER